MKTKLNRLSRRYFIALRTNLNHGPQAIPPCGTALALGRRALALGLQTLDLARIHEQALMRLMPPGGFSGTRDRIIKRAEIFFTEAITPIEKTHRAELESNVHLSQLRKILCQRTVDLAASRRSLKHGFIQRKTVEQALKKSGEHSKKLLKESHRLQEHLQCLTHQILSAQEDKRRTISRDLHNEIAQTLLGINVRLLTLKKEAAINSHGLKKDIANTQRLVDKSAKSIRRVAHEFGIHNGT